MQPKLYSISAHLPFADALAAWLLKRYGDDPASLSRVLVLLPSRRASSSLREAFLRASGGKPLLLPRMQPIGDVDDAAMLAGGWTGKPETALPNESFAFRRLLILTRLIKRKQAMRTDHAYKLALELARLLDELENEGLSLGDAGRLVSEDFAAHWQETADFLRIISEVWPALEREEGIAGPVACRNRMLQALAEKWRRLPPRTPVVIAGVTGGIPAVTKLAQAVMELPEGMVVLPGLDLKADTAYRAHVLPGHPQWQMLKLLESLKRGIDEVEEIAYSGAVDISPERLLLLSEIMRPAALSEQWQHLEVDIGKAMRGVHYQPCATMREEALFVALLLRETLEHPGKTAALVTADRALARQVCAMMKRFGVVIDDSSGVPLMQMSLAVFLRLVAEAAMAPDDLMLQLALLKHPLAHLGMRRAECLESARLWEIAMRQGGGRAINEDALAVSATLRRMLAPLSRCIASGASLVEIIAAHVACAEAVAGEALWEGREAEAVINVIAALRAAGTETAFLVEDARHGYASFFESFFEGKVWRAEFGLHPRLKILGLIEARMQSFDRLVLGGLNEGSWPRNASYDPWLNRRMRSQAGLPPPEIVTGMEAHDFYMQLCAAPEVYLTRPYKVEGAPATPSRWLVKLEALLERFSPSALSPPDLSWIAFTRMLDASSVVEPCPRPAPSPPLSVRPASLSVTQIEKLMRNPYALYASVILGLKPLEAIDREAGAQDFGNAVHKTLEIFTKLYPSALPSDPYAALLETGKGVLENAFGKGGVFALWWPRFTRIARFIVEQEVERRPHIQRVWCEADGDLRINGFLLTGRADRIEETKNGHINIIDYKTGMLPTSRDIRQGFAKQLALLALVMEKQPMFTLGATIGSLEYWRLIGGEEMGEIKPAATPEAVPAYMRRALEDVEQLVAFYADPAASYHAMPSMAGKHDDYAHLARVKEWQKD